MVNPVSGANASVASQAAAPAVGPKSQPQQSTPLPADTVSLKSVGGDADHDGH
jgi:hypothetical protein